MIEDHNDDCGEHLDSLTHNIDEFWDWTTFVDCPEDQIVSMQARSASWPPLFLLSATGSQPAQFLLLPAAVHQ